MRCIHQFRAVQALCLLAAGATLALAADSPEMVKARDAHAAWVKTRSAPARPDLAPTAGTVNRAVFRRAFAQTDLTAWDADADSALLRDGLYLTVEQGTEADDVDRAVTAGERFLELFAEDEDAPAVRGLYLPSCHLVAGGASSALDLLDRVGAKVPEPLRPEARRLAGDILAAMGDPTRAREHFEAALTAVGPAPEIPDTFSGPAQLAEMQRALRTLEQRGRLEIRLQLIGKTLPKLPTSGGSKGAATAQKSVAGRAVVIYLFSAGIEEHVAGLLELDALARELGAGQVSVLAATWFESLATGKQDGTASMLLPKGRDDLASDEVTVKPSNLPLHVRKLHKALGLVFPLAVVKEKVARKWVPENLGGAFVATDMDHEVAVAGDAADLERKSALLREALMRPITPPDEGPEEPK